MTHLKYSKLQFSNPKDWAMMRSAWMTTRADTRHGSDSKRAVIGGGGVWHEPGLRLGHDKPPHWFDATFCSLGGTWLRTVPLGGSVEPTAGCSSATLIYESRKDLTCDTGSRICADSTGCQEALCIKLRGGIFQPVYSFPPKAYTYKQTSTAHSPCSDICSADKSLWCARHEKECSAIFGCIVHWRGEWRNRKTNLTVPDKGSACLLRPTYINLLLWRPCLVYICIYLYIYTPVCAGIKGQRSTLQVFKFICVSWVSLYGCHLFVG